MEQWRSRWVRGAFAAGAGQSGAHAAETPGIWRAGFGAGKRHARGCFDFSFSDRHAM
jgi:hypothetical protein